MTDDGDGNGDKPVSLPPYLTHAQLAALPPLMTEDQLATLIHCSRSKVEKDRAAGVGIPFIKVGRRVLYALEDVIKYCRKHTFRSTAEAKTAESLKLEARSERADTRRATQ
jgi:hypothetical protein